MNTWRKGTHIKTSADIAAKVFDELAGKNQLNAQALVDTSRPEEAPLHPEFEWNDAIAAEEWRKQRARNLITALVVIEEKEEEAVPVQVYHHLDTDGSNYKSISVIMQSQEDIETLRKQALQELISFKLKYKRILDIVNGSTQIDILQTMLETGA